MQIAILLYDRFTALDAVGPYEILSRIPGAEVVFAAARPGPVRTDMASLALTADAALSHTGHTAIRSRGGSRTPRSIPSRSMSGTGASPPRPASPPASTLPWH